LTGFNCVQQNCERFDKIEKSAERKDDDGHQPSATLFEEEWKEDTKKEIVPQHGGVVLCSLH